MKHTFLIFGLLCVFASCKKEESPSRAEVIVGEWTLKAEGYDQNADGLLQNTEIDSLAAGTQIFEVYRADGSGDYIVRLRGLNDDLKSSFQWRFANGDGELQRIVGTDTVSRTILKLDGGRMERYDPQQTPRLLQILEK